MVHEADDIAYLANQNTVTFHMWTSTVDRPNHPDWMVIDLDPEEGNLDGVRKATQLICGLLERFELTGFPMATGSKGFHVWVPLDGILDFGAVSRVSRALAGLATTQAPDLLTTEFLKKNRKGRVFVDWLRNAPTATVVVPFSLRPRSGAPVAVPLTWEELKTAEPGGCKMGHVATRLELELDLTPQLLPVDQIVEAALEAGVDLDTPHDRFGR